VLAQHPLGEEHEHEQAHGERRLDDHEGSEQQGEHLERPAQDGEACAQQPARSPDQTPRQREPQVLLVGRLLGVHRLERDP
jgi:hypothetical protein